MNNEINPIDLENEKEQFQGEIEEQKSNDITDGKNKKKRIWFNMIEWVVVIVIALVIALLIRNFVFEPVLVNGPSMNNTLHTDERLILYKFGYLFSKPQKGDIVVIEINGGRYDYLPLPDKERVDYIKRVIAVAGDEIKIQNGNVYVNNKLLNEPYIVGKTYYSGNPNTKFVHVVAKDSIFVMGDNRENSRDSRILGDIELSRVRGKATFRFWPFNNIGSLK
jgi:signal peptidase I